MLNDEKILQECDAGEGSGGSNTTEGATGQLEEVDSGISRSVADVF